MKKSLALILTLAILLVFSACGGNENVTSTSGETQLPATESSSNLPLYPTNTNESVYLKHPDIPKIIFSTTGAENGLSGTLYSFSGKMIGPHEKLDESFFVVETQYGNVLMMNVYYDIKDYMPVDEASYTPPEIGTYARFTCIYDGFSGTAEMPCFTYGNDDFLLSTYSASPEETEPTEAPTTTPAIIEPIIFEGSGDKVLTDINLESGRYKVHITYTGNGVFAVFGYDADDDMVIMESSYGACEKEEVLRQAKFPLILEVTADAAWKIEFERID